MGERGGGGVTPTNTPHESPPKGGYGFFRELDIIIYRFSCGDKF